MEGQLTIFDWVALKEDIRRKLQETADNFVYIGYKLKQIDAVEGYRNDGAANIYEFAEKEYGLSRTVTSRFMAINTKFSVDGNSTELLPQYRNLGSSKLQEMLNLSDEDCTLITEQTTVKEIRELKNFNRQQVQEESAQPECTAPAAGVEEKEYTPLQKCIIDYFSAQGKRETLNAVLKMSFEGEQSEATTRQQAELINPSEYDSHVKGIIYLFMYEYDKGVAYKTVTKSVVTKLSWAEFIGEIAGIYGDSYGPDTWGNFYGSMAETVESEKEEKKLQEKETVREPEKPMDTGVEGCATSHKKEEISATSVGTDSIKDSATGNLLTPSEEGEETTENEENSEGEDAEDGAEDVDNNLPGQTSIEKDFPQYMPDSTGSIVENPYYKLQDEVIEAANLIGHIVSLHKHLVIPGDYMQKLKDNIARMSAIVEQLEEMGRE